VVGSAAATGEGDRAGLASGDECIEEVEDVVEVGDGIAASKGSGLFNGGSADASGDPAGGGVVSCTGDDCSPTSGLRSDTGDCAGSGENTGDAAGTSAR
jgi:hypothetical protein